jgi:DNA polymerase-3 subunit alpha
MAFIHLHNHTEYSLLDGATRVKDMAKQAAEFGMSAIAITDHGYMYGVPSFVGACKGAGVKPIVGCEVYFTPDDELRRDQKPDLYHMILLAKSAQGYGNLTKICSHAATRGFYYKPRVTRAMLKQFAGGLIGTSACVAGIIPQRLLAALTDEAEQWARELSALFDPGDFYIELQDQGLIFNRDERGAQIAQTTTQKELNVKLDSLAKALGLKTVAANDMHYLKRGDSFAQDLMLCIGTNSKVDDQNRMRFDNDQFYMKSEAEMRKALAGFEDACDNTIEVAEKCNFELSESAVVSMATATGTRLAHGKILPLPPTDHEVINNASLRAQAKQALLKYGSKASKLKFEQETDLKAEQKPQLELDPMQEPEQNHELQPEQNHEPQPEQNPELDPVQDPEQNPDQVPDLEPEDLQFYADSLAGLKRLYGDPVPDVAMQRFEYEYSVIVEQGFPTYFLVVAEFVSWAKANGVGVGPGRGSAAGSIISYALGITTLDPLENGLLFERFMSLERVEMPDIDIDFDENGRADVINHIRDVYGEKSVANVITYGSMKAKQAIVDTTRVLDLPINIGANISKKITGGPVASLKAALGTHSDKELNQSQRNPDLIDEYKNNPDTKRIIDSALLLEGALRGEGVHASAVIISPVDVDSLVPIKLDTKGGSLVTQYDGKNIANLGLLKMDFLGLRTLNVLMKAKEYVLANHNTSIDLDNIPFDDPKVFEMLRNGDTAGVFQVESSGMTSLIRSMKADRYSDIVAAIALFRPGPLNSGMLDDFVARKVGKRKVVYYDNRLANILQETYGTLVYQEQVMFISMQMSGFTAGESDVVRKAVAKKNIKLMKEEKRKWADGAEETMQEHWLNGAERNQFSRKTAQTIWDDVEKFAEYAFNKSHSAAYAILVMQTAWIKAHYPVEFMAAVLSSFVGKADRLTSYISETRKSGIAVLPPDVNSSGREFTPLVGDTKGIRFGLAGIRGVGTAAADFIISEREAAGPYTSLHDFVFRVPNTYCDKGAVEALIKSGAFDSTGYTRRQMIRFLEIDKLMAIAAKRHRDKADGQVTIFDMFGDANAVAETLGFEDKVPEPDGIEWERRDKLHFEKEILKMYVSDHPLSPYEAILARCREFTLGAFAETDDDEELMDATVGSDDDMTATTSKPRPPKNRKIALAGMITSVTPMVSKKGDRMAKFILEDTEGSIEAIVFPSYFEKCKDVLAEDNIVCVTGRYEHDRGAQILVNEMSRINVEKDLQANAVVEFSVNASLFSQMLVERLLKILRLYPGTNAVVLYVQQSDGRRVRAELPVTVNASAAQMHIEVKQLLETGAMA